MGATPVADHRPQMRSHVLILIEHHHTPRAARSGLQPQGTGTGERIQAMRALDHRRQPVKQRFANAIAGRPQIGRFWHHNPPPAPAPADDPHPSGIISFRHRS